jgi:hypothetical protein
MGRGGEMEPEKKLGPSPWIAIGVSILSLSISVISALVSITTLYYTHFYVSENLYAVLLSFDIRNTEETDSEGNKRSLLDTLIANLALANSGNQNIIISRIYTSYSHIAYDSVSARRLVEAKKLNEDTLATPLLISPHNVEQLSVRFPLETNTLLNPRGQKTEELQIPFDLVFTTIGGSGKVQLKTIPFINLRLKDGQFIRGTGDLASPVPIRE